MCGFVDVLGAIWEGREGEWFVYTFNSPSLVLIVGEFYENDIIMVAAILWTGIMHVLFIHRTFPKVDGCRCVAVGIVVPWSSTEIGELS